MDKGLRNQPFSDTILREMVMVFPKGRSRLVYLDETCNSC